MGSGWIKVLSGLLTSSNPDFLYRIHFLKLLEDSKDTEATTTLCGWRRTGHFDNGRMRSGFDLASMFTESNRKNTELEPHWDLATWI